MASQIIIWTVLPNGFTSANSDAKLRLSVLVSPRLQPDGDRTLAPFDDFLDWPAQLRRAGVEFAVQVDNEPPISARVTSAPPDSKLWQALFDVATLVQPHEFDDYANRPLVSYPAGRVLSFLKERYQQIATQSPSDLPSLGTIGQTFSDLRRVWSILDTFGMRSGSEKFLTERLRVLIEEGKREARTRRANFANSEIVDPLGAPIQVGSQESDFSRFMLFHYRPAKAVPAKMPGSEPAASAEDFRQMIDFHKMLSSLAEFPALMRQLGLVLDLEVDATALPFVTPGPGHRFLRVVPSFTPRLVQTKNHLPRTAYQHFEQGASRFFEAAPRNFTRPETFGRFANMRLPGLQVIQVDVDGAAFKALNLASTLMGQSVQDALPFDAPVDGGLATLRSGGFSIVRDGHAGVMNDGFNAAHNNNVKLVADANEPATFFAEDLTRGFRVDVLEVRAGQWRSLHKRIGTYSFLNHPDGPLKVSVTDEGCIQPALTAPAADRGTSPDPAAELYVHESQFRWEGWSLSAPRPGKSINRDPRAPRPDLPETQPERVPNTAVENGFQLETAFVVEPGSLPRLRFGSDYQFRLRAVDLAGNGLALDEAETLLQTLTTQFGARLTLPQNSAETTYRRFEPVSAPVLVLRRELNEGESLERLVVRSNHNLSAQQYAALHPEFESFNDRHVAPPKTSQLMAEVSGMFDALFSAGASVQQTYDIARREKGSLNDITGPSIRFVPTRDGNGYSIHTEAGLTLPYLPDPFSRGAALRNLPGIQAGRVGQLDVNGDLVFAPASLPEAEAQALGSTLKINFGQPQDWPDLFPFRIRLTEGANAPAWDKGNRVLTIALAKAETAIIRLSSFISEEDLPQLGIWQWTVERLESDPGNFNQRLQTFTQQAVAGNLWMLTPFRELTLVHAVQQPVEQPKILSLHPHKQMGITFAVLGGEVRVHGKSTSKLDLIAHWQEPIDRLDEPAPRTLSASAHVVEVPIHLPGESTAAVTPPPDAVPIATYDPTDDLVRFLAPSSPDDFGPGFSVRIPPIENFLSRHEFGDTKHRKVRYETVATTRFREYFPEAITNSPSSISRTSQPVELEILNSARPAAPRVLYVLPTFEWQKPADPVATVQVRKRLGGGLRVYLDRPWYSSGGGELLGVVLCPELNFPPDDNVRPYVTQWGRDPVWATRPPIAAPFVSDFKRVVSSAAELSLDEFANAKEDAIRTRKVAVAGHAVQYDSQRQLWFCDIEIDAGDSYFPFVRLALARFQPDSVTDAHLSRVVLADFAQLAPDRTVTLVSEPDNPDLFNIALAGLSYRFNTGPVPTSEPEQVGGDIEVSVEERLAGTSGDLGWLPTAIKVHVDQNSTRGGLLWSGHVTLPPEREAKQFRLAIREFERYASDAVRGFTVNRRLVFADTVEFDGPPSVTSVGETAFLVLHPILINGSPTNTSAICEAQRKLNLYDAQERAAARVGLEGAPLVEDCVLGDATATAVHSFQQQKGLLPDGIIGPLTWAALDDILTPSGVASGRAMPLEGSVRWSVTLNDLASLIGTVIAFGDVSSLTVLLADVIAANPQLSSDGARLFFTPGGKPNESSVDLSIESKNGAAITLPQALRFTTDIRGGLEGLNFSLAIAIQEAALAAAVDPSPTLRAFITRVRTAINAYQEILLLMQERMGADPSPADLEAWQTHMAAQARFVMQTINEQATMTLGSPPLARLDGQPFAGADEEPEVDTGAQLLLMTPIENVVVASDVNLDLI